MPVSTGCKNTHPASSQAECNSDLTHEGAKAHHPDRSPQHVPAEQHNQAPQESTTASSTSSHGASHRPFVFDVFKNYHRRPFDRAPPLANSYLKPNARYVGEQQSSKTRHLICVEFKTVDLVNSMMTGFLQISGLTDDNPEITTCFKGEIINNPLLHSSLQSPGLQARHKVLRTFSFFTENSLWQSNHDNDLVHWSKLTGLEYLSDDELIETLRREQDSPDQHIYMRWKEEFLLPDSRVKRIPNASFEGFYYVVLTVKGRDAGSVRGLYYYHKDPEKFQSLNMKFVEDQGHSSLFEFV